MNKETCICGREMLKGITTYRGCQINTYECECGETSRDLDDMEKISKKLVSISHTVAEGLSQGIGPKIDNLDAEAIVKEVRSMSRFDVMLLEIKSIESLIVNMNPEDERDVEETLHWIRYCADIGLAKEA